MLARRSSRVLEYPSTYHVVPAGTFQPSDKSHFYDPLETTPFGTVLRELYEECFLGSKGEKYIIDKYPIPLNEILNRDEIKFIYNNRNDPSKVEFRIMGIYFDYFIPKVEMTTCLVVHDPDYLKFLENNGKLIINWENNTELLKEPFTEYNVKKWIGSENMLRIGAVALEDATDACKNQLKKN